MLAALKENKDVISKSLTTNLKNSSLIPIGRIQKAHGIKGEILLIFDSGENLKFFPKALYFESFNKKEVERARLSLKGMIVKLKEVSTRDQAHKFLGQKVYLEKNLFKSRKGESFYLCELLGFSLYSEGKKLGSVDHFLSHSHHDWLVIKKNKKKLEMPFVKNYIQKIHFKEKRMDLLLPKNFPGLEEKGGK